MVGLSISDNNKLVIIGKIRLTHLELLFDKKATNLQRAGCSEGLGAF